MAKLQDHEIGFLANAIQNEIGADARELAPLLLSEVLASTVKVPKQQYLDYVRRNWPDPKFRQDLYTRIAPPGPLGMPRKENVKAFLALVEAAHKVPDAGIAPSPFPAPQASQQLSLPPDQSNAGIPNIPGPIGPGSGPPAQGGQP